MDTIISKKILFNASCVALIVTAMTFAIRAGILVELGNDFNLNNTQLGWINSMAFWGFPVATIFGGLLYNYFGPKKLLVAAFLSHLIGLVMTIYADGFTTLLISSFLIGFANGSVEAACNPLIADMYSNNRTTMLNKFHVWFPGGIVIGALATNFMNSLGLGWQLKIAIMIVPTLIYGFMFFKALFPKSENIDTDTSNNIKSLFSLLFIFIAICMTLTATTELGTQQWLQPLLEKSGASPMLILAMVTGIMAVGRYFAGPIVHKLNPIGVLFMSAIVSTVAIYMMSIVDGTMLYGASILFAFGVCYFWPTMIGFVSEYMPKTGALGMSLVGGMGMFATGIWNPIIGSWIDTNTQTALDSGLTQDLAEIAAGKATLGNMTYFPLILIIFFGILFLNRKNLEKLRVNG
ncbi:MAG: MFS transporter [Flavobacteriaceae bacterium]|nr:MFS transporter [Flavobacteriaceae bacterium]MBL6684782.1 MFS transporter [Flavobacteriaceae bacterium]|tara:strand:+ start:957 stop:2174 length:1218 start_codon:yes stop_codon:yes gene_type:complete